ncbi:hypothetical protein Pla175_40970 [Pirellulimonas nuda]|uniref:NIPSNAP domain-containing protein n=1 Tax=Pirellulimonas nuda TaxID=2528009 RepID=A0A518DGU2_9BACT|nr:NIPSNAP family protein [Pirellulimonas nuda]QDU90688.1 hypothetical protein Pla175_40970 [Pirellulimonas nuda]
MAALPRRQFLSQSAAVAGAWGAASGLAQAASQEGAGPPAAGRQFYEWRSMRLAGASQQARVLEYLKSAALPAWGRLGIGPVGVFTEIGPQAGSDVHVLLTFDTHEQLLGERTGLEADAPYRDAAAGYLAAGKDDPAFGQIDSSLLVAFAGQPKLQTPRQRPRVLELRTYHSHSEAKARRKVEMFNEGEIPIFRKAGFETVFFGESLIGPGLPNLKYMLAADDMTANEAGWKGFIGHPDWAAMKDLPRYADTVSKIEKLFLKPAAFSQV